MPERPRLLLVPSISESERLQIRNATENSDSVDVKEKLGFVALLGLAGFELIVVSGAVVSGVGAGSWISHE